MALYHFSIDQVRRSAGQSAIAAAAYRAGERLYSDYYGEISDYTKKGGVICSEIFLPPNAPKKFLDRATLWNAVEQTEKHPQAQLSYSFDVALQNEFSLEKNIALAREFVQRQFVAKGMIADLAVHVPDKEGGIPNPHFHVMTTMRPLNADGSFGAKQRREYVLDENGDRVRDENGNYVFNAVHTTDWHEPETLVAWREAWCNLVNAKFEEKGLDCRIDHRSYVRQGLDLIPTVHEGPNVRKMEAKGLATEKGQLNRWIRATNRLIADLKRKIKALSAWLAEVKDELKTPPQTNLADFLIAYLNRRNASAWSKKARTGNLKEFNGIYNYLMENKLYSVEELEKRLASVSTEFDTLSAAQKARSARMKELQELLRQAEHYERTKPIFQEMNKLPWKDKREKFREAHDGDLRLFFAARRVLREKLGDQPIEPEAWKKEYAQLQQEYAEASAGYKPLREDLMQLRKIQHWVDVAGSDKSYGFCHKGEGNQLFVFEAPIDLMSFLCLYPKDWKSRSYLSLGGVSGKALERFLSERPDVKQVFLCLDSDTAGCDACKRLAESLPDSLTVIRLLPARKDWNEVLQHREEIPNQKFIAETVTLQETKTEPPVPMIRMSQMAETAVDWLWFPYIPFGKLTIVQGNPGEGKTYFAMQLAAACTNRKPLPDMEASEPFNVIYQTAEDGLGDTVKPRLQEAGADLDRVLVIDDGDQPLTLSDERLEKAIRQNSTRLLIIDPVQAFLGANVDMNRANEVRPIFRRLGDVAQHTGCAILLIGHLNKAAAELGISARTVRQVKQKLGKKLHSERSGTQWILSLKNKAQRVDDAAGLPLRHLQIPCAAKRYRRTGAPSGGYWINI